MDLFIIFIFFSRVTTYWITGDFVVVVVVFMSTAAIKSTNPRRSSQDDYIAADLYRLVKVRCGNRGRAEQAKHAERFIKFI